MSCPYHNNTNNTAQITAPIQPKTNRDWWPNTLDLRILNQDPPTARPSHTCHPNSYPTQFSRCNLTQLRNDIYQALTTSNPHWPADYNHYGPLMVRLAWHSAGTYRTFDGRGGGNSANIRLAPLNSWPDNANLDKVRRYILWPIKQRYGNKISWGDLIILAGNVAIESMMGEWGTVEPLWFGGGRVDAYAPEEDVYWGNEGEWLKDDRHHQGDDVARGNESGGTGLEKPLGAVQMGLIYVNPEGPGGSPDVLASAKDIRETFYRMGMNDEETVALIAGGHTFGKAHGAADPDKYVGAEPEGAAVEEMGLGWKNGFGSGRGKDTITSGLEGAWTVKPTRWDNGYFDNLFRYEWEKTKSPGGAIQWVPDAESIAKNGGESAVQNVPDAHDATMKHLPIMFTTDLALRYDPLYGPISKKFHSNPEVFTDAFKRAWYKLCHRDMGPKSRHLGPWVPREELIWLDPIPGRDYNTVTSYDVKMLKNEILDGVTNKNSGLTISDLIKAAWASASTYRKTDYRGGANGGRIRLLPQRNWSVNDPPSLEKVIALLEGIQTAFNERRKLNNVQVSFADLVVIAGNAAIEEAARRGGKEITIPFVPGRTDATQEQTDVDSFQFLEPVIDAFRNYNGCDDGRPEKALVDRAHLLSLTTPEMVVLLGGLRVLNVNTDSSQVGVLTEQPGVLTNDFFTTILDDNVKWSHSSDGKLFQGTGSNGKNWTASRADLIIGSNSQLRAIAETYACADSTEYFIQDFINAWVKVMMLDRFDLLREDDVDESTTLLYMRRTSSIHFTFSIRQTIRQKIQHVLQTESLLRVAYNITLDEWDASSKATTSYHFTSFLELSSSTLLQRIDYVLYAELEDFETCLPRDDCSQIVVAGLPTDGYQLSFDGNTIETGNEFYYDGINPATSTFVGLCSAPTCVDAEALFELEYWSGRGAFDVAYRVEDKDGEYVLGEDNVVILYYQITKSYACLPRDNACYTFLISLDDPTYYSHSYSPQSYSVFFDGKVVGSSDSFLFDSVQFGDSCEPYCNQENESLLEFFMYDSKYFKGDYEYEWNLSSPSTSASIAKGVVPQGPGISHLAHSVMCVPKSSCVSFTIQSPNVTEEVEEIDPETDDWENVTYMNVTKAVSFLPTYSLTMNNVTYRKARWSSSGGGNQTTNMGSCTVTDLCDEQTQELFHLELLTKAEYKKTLDSYSNITESLPLIDYHSIGWEFDAGSYSYSENLYSYQYNDNAYALNSSFEVIECVSKNECAFRSFDMETSSAVERYSVKENGKQLNYTYTESISFKTPFSENCPEPAQMKNSLSVAAIVGIALASLVGLAIVYLFCSRTKKEEEGGEEAEP